MRIGGLTATEAEALIARRLRDGSFVQNPQVTLLIQQFRSQQVAVLGNVGRPGRYPIEMKGTRLTDILAAAGGILPYAFTIAIANAVALGALSALEGHRPWKLPAREWRFGLIVCTISMTSYMLVLYAFSRGNLGPVSALRETSVLFATAFAALVLKERVGRVEWLSAALAVCGIAMIRLG